MIKFHSHAAEGEWVWVHEVLPWMWDEMDEFGMMLIDEDGLGIFRQKNFDFVYHIWKEAHISAFPINAQNIVWLQK